MYNFIGKKKSYYKTVTKYYKEIDWTQPIITGNGKLGGDKFSLISNGYVQAKQTNGSLTWGQPLDGDIWAAFDKDTTNRWRSGTTTGYFIFYNPNPLKVSSILWGYFYCYPTNGSVYGSNDNKEWVLLASYTNSVETDFTIAVNSAMGYKYHKITIDGVNKDVIHTNKIVITAKEVIDGAADDYTYISEEVVEVSEMDDYTSTSEDTIRYKAITHKIPKYMKKVYKYWKHTYWKKWQPLQITSDMILESAADNYTIDFSKIDPYALTTTSFIMKCGGRGNMGEFNQTTCPLWKLFNNTISTVTDDNYAGFRIDSGATSPYSISVDIVLPFSDFANKNLLRVNRIDVTTRPNDNYAADIYVGIRRFAADGTTTWEQPVTDNKTTTTYITTSAAATTYTIFTGSVETDWIYFDLKNMSQWFGFQNLQIYGEYQVSSKDPYPTRVEAIEVTESDDYDYAEVISVIEVTESDDYDYIEYSSINIGYKEE